MSVKKDAKKAKAVVKEVEEKIEECLSAARRGETSISISRDDLTDDEISYIQKEVQRRLRNG